MRACLSPPGLVTFRTLLLTTCLCALTRAEAQRTVLVMTADGPVPKGALRAERFDTPPEAEARAEAWVKNLWTQGALEASLDTCILLNDTLRCALHRGPDHRWAVLSGSGIPHDMAGRTRFRERAHAGKAISPNRTVKLLDDLLRDAEDHGHPFASVRLDSLRSTGDGLLATVHVDLGPLVRIDSVVVKGTARISPRYLHQHIGIRPGDVYDESLILALDRRIRELPFVTQRQRPYVLFAPERTKLYLFLEPRRASSINGILGVLPDAATGRVAFTGDVDLRLRNALRRGESIDLNWRSLKDRTQDLKVRTAVPFLFQTPFGIDLSLKLFRRDTSFLEVNGRGALQLALRQGDVMSVFVNSKSSRALGRSTTLLPGLGNVKLLTYGLGIERQRFDYRLNPQRGHSIILEGSAGNKESRVPDPNDNTLTVTTRSLQVQIDGHVVVHWALGRRGTVRLAAQGGAMINDRLFLNELYRLGGIRNLRGVDEASIYASSFAIGTLEYRLLLEENSNAFVFVDQAWWEDRSRAEPLADDPIGFGIGTNFETKAGIFSLTYALGSQFNNPFDLRDGKVHFGFTSLF
ncbi:MAG TPA: BamA/TamA family outer membrane protein [Flavobacteriales bacterium]|nr:BamA/TamA family outer membrane protein [Flavobacteriales bacterium]HMR27546.1 BamA/TamA family outer membrane protein [Flavobacteriales bacterium]